MPISNNFASPYSNARQFSLVGKRKILFAAKPKDSSIFDKCQPIEGKGVYCPSNENKYNSKYDNIQPNEGKGVYSPPYFKELNKNHKEINNDPKKLGNRQVVQITVYERQSLSRLVKIITGNFFRFSKAQAIQKLGKKASKESLECLCSIALRNKKFEWEGAQRHLFEQDGFLRLQALNSISMLYEHFSAEVIYALKEANKENNFQVELRAEYLLKKLTTKNGAAKKAQEKEFQKIQEFGEKKIPDLKKISPEEKLFKIAIPQTQKRKRIYSCLPITENIISQNYLIQ